MMIVCLFGKQEALENTKKRRWRTAIIIIKKLNFISGSTTFVEIFFLKKYFILKTSNTLKFVNLIIFMFSFKSIT